MHKDDQMTPVERAYALSRGEAADRMPIGLFYGAPAHSLLGWTRQQQWESGRTLAQVKRTVYETFGADGISVGYGLHGMAVALGALVTQDPHIPIAIRKQPLERLEDVGTLDMDIFTVEKDPTAGKCFEALQIMRDELGKEVACTMSFTGPFTSASGIAGVENLLKGTLRKPQKVNELMEFVTQATIRLAIPFVREGFGISFVDPVSSCSMIQRCKFQEFSEPYIKRIVRALKDAGAPSIGCHVCGNTIPILDDIADCGFSSLSVDNCVELSEVKAKIGDRLRISGNIDPVKIIYQGTPEEVKAAVRSCYRDGFDSQKGYTVSFGCDAVYGTPVRNIYAYMEEARRCARYPVRPENFAAR